MGEGGEAVSLTDPQIRALLRPLLPSGLVVDELELRGAASVGIALTTGEMDQPRSTVRADVVVVADLLHGYEIKSARDSRTRLARQVAGYSAVFDFCTLVTEPKHLSAASALLPSWWSVLVVEGDAIRVERTGEQHAPEPEALIRLLWKDEMRALYRAHGLWMGRSEGVADLWKRAPEIPLVAIRAAVAAAITKKCAPGGSREWWREVRAEQAERDRERAEEERQRTERLRAFVGDTTTRPEPQEARRG